ncbi:MAG: metal-sensitive transcriptional regulator [Sporolactobacillus sp.]
MVMQNDNCGCEIDQESLSDRSPAEPRTSEEKQKLINRLRRVEGQIRGVQKMVEDDRYCIDILIQLSAVRAALQKIGYSVLERHTKSCVAKAIEEGHGSEQVDELLKVLKQFYK